MIQWENKWQNCFSKDLCVQSVKIQIYIYLKRLIV